MSNPSSSTQLLCDCCKEKNWALYMQNFEGLKVCGGCYGELVVVDQRLSFFNRNGCFAMLADNPADPFSSNDLFN